MGATLKSMQRESKSSAPRAFWATYCDFAANTGVHGVKYITETDRRPWERVLWFAVVVVGLVGAGMMTATFWERFSTAPTRASVETNFYPSWRLPFPAATLCNMNHIFRSHAKALFDNLGAVREERALASEGLALMMELVQPNPANSSYRPDLVRAMTELFQRNGMTYREAMAHLDQTCEEMLERCMWEGEIVKCQDIFEERKSYLGMCCSFNYRGVIETTNGNGKKILEVAPGKPRHTPYYSHRLGLSVLMNPMAHDYYMTSLHSAGIRMLIHRVDDYPDESAEEKILPVGREMLVGVTAKSYYCTEDVRGLVPTVRGCVFQDERRLRYFPIYSATNCLTECRINYSALFCNCSPFYYHEVEEIRTCTFEDIPCLDKYYFALRRRLNSMVIVKDQDAMTSSTTATAINCDCPPLCSQVDYDVHVSSGDFNASQYQRSRLLKGANVTGRTLMHFFMSNSVSKRTKRDVVSSWSELLSSLGGVFSLCLGFSVLSVIEMIYFFTMRLAFRYRRLALPAGRPGVIDDADLLQPPVISNNVPKFLSQPSQKSKPFPTRVGAWGTAPTVGFSLWKNQL